MFDRCQLVLSLLTGNEIFAAAYGFVSLNSTTKVWEHWGNTQIWELPFTQVFTISPVHMAPPKHHKHIVAASAWACLSSCAGWKPTGQREQTIAEFILHHFLSRVNNVFLPPSHHLPWKWQNFNAFAATTALSNLTRFAGSELLGWGHRRADHTAYTWQITRPAEVRKQSWKLLSVLEQNSSKTDLDICLHYPLILADILMATFLLNKKLLFWNKTVNLKGE